MAVLSDTNETRLVAVAVTAAAFTPESLSRSVHFPDAKVLLLITNADIKAARFILTIVPSEPLSLV